MSPDKKGSQPSNAMPSQETFTNRLAERRKIHGLSQAALAKQAGITRQAIYAIEGNQYLPSTQISLQLAKILKCQVEDLFSLQEDTIIQAELIGSRSVQQSPIRVNLARVGKRILARPMTNLGDMLNFVLPADGVIVEGSSRRSRTKHGHVSVRLLHAPEAIEQNLVIAGCDPALFLAGEHIRKIHALSGVTNWTLGSVNALRALQRGEVHIAGLHLVDSKSGQSNVPYLKRHARNRGLVGVHFARWVQGFFIQPGNPKRIKAVQDLMKPGIRLVNREAGAGARFFLDALLEEAGMIGKSLKGYQDEVPSHIEAARCIRDGRADVGIGVETAAYHLGLDFIPLREERYDLIMQAEFLNQHPTGSTFLDTLVSRPFRQEIEALGGYNLAEIGKILEW